LIAIVALAGALAPAGAGPEPIAANKPLAEEQLKLVDQALADLDRLYKGGELSLTSPEIALWERRRLDALRARGATKAEMVAALTHYLDHARQVEQYMKAMVERDQATRTDSSGARYQRLEAEIWLNQEKAR
jgi:hypothetical protein